MSAAWWILFGGIALVVLGLFVSIAVDISRYQRALRKGRLKEEERRWKLSGYDDRPME